MEKSVLDMTDSLRYQKLGLATSESRYFQVIFVVKVRAQKVDSHFLNTQLPLNEYGNNLYKNGVMDLVCLNILSSLLMI